MNSERRHELQQNVLAQHLGGILKQIEPYTKWIAIAFAGLVVAVVGVSLLQSNTAMNSSDATLELLQNAGSGDPEALAAVSDRFAKTSAGTLARLYQADANLLQGVNSLFTDRELAEAQIGDALKAYRQVLDAAKDPLLESRAHFGIARAHESIADTDKAIESYRQVVALNESDAIVEAAQHRIDLLQKSETQEFLAWFEKQDFAPADPALPPSLPGANGLPDLPDLNFPDVAPMQFPGELKGGGEAQPAPPLSAEIEVPSETEASTDPGPSATDEPADPLQIPETQPADAPPQPESPSPAAFDVPAESTAGEQPTERADTPE